ncbi:MAG: hypothetical protein ACJ74J_03200 [Blastocatellia bacterium]
MSENDQENAPKSPRQLENPTVPASGMTQGTTSGGTGPTSGAPEDQTTAQQESDPSPYAGTSGGHSRGGETF